MDTNNLFNNNTIESSAASKQAMENNHVSDPRQIKLQSLLEATCIDPYEPQHQNGPDYIIPTEALFTCRADGAVKLRIENRGRALQKPESIITILKRNAEKIPNQTAMVIKRNKRLQWSYADYLIEVRTVAKAFIKLGLEPLHGVGVLGLNSPEWFIAAIGSIFAGGFVAGIYPTNNPSACHHVLQNSNSNIVLVENDLQLQKILQVKDTLPKLKAIIQFLGTPTHPEVLSWQDLLKIGRTVDDKILERRIRGTAVNQCCSIIFTSGTVGEPKATMLSHDNVTYMVKLCLETLGVQVQEKEVFLSYLPLSHAAAQLADMFGGMVVGSAVHFAPPEALKGGFVDTTREVKPTRVLGVPRIWEKIYEKLKEAELEMGSVKKSFFNWAKRRGYLYYKSICEGAPAKPFGYSLAYSFVFRPLLERLGFERTKTSVTGAAPVSTEVLDYLMSLGIMIYEGYGMSESTGPVTVNTPNDLRVGSVGKPMPSISIKIVNPDEKGNGEIYMSGRNVFMGYLNMPTETAESLDEEGWIHSGDIGRFDDDGYLYITGRIKEIIVTSGGENISPVLIEETVKKHLPIISNAMLIGDKRKFLSILLTLKTEVDPDSFIPSDNLTLASQEWCRSIGSNSKTVSSILKGPDKKVMDAIQKGISNANKEAISNAQRIQKWKILPHDFSVQGGQLGPTLKLKRQVVHKENADLIEEFYS